VSDAQQHSLGESESESVLDRNTGTTDHHGDKVQREKWNKNIGEKYKQK